MATALPARDAEAWLDDFVARSRAAVFVRRADQLLMVRPDKTLSINRTATDILAALYARDAGPASRVLDELAPRLRVDRQRLGRDALDLARAVAAILNEDYRPRPGLKFGEFDRSAVEYPTLAEIALTYRCQNRCAFCYADSPERGDPPGLMSTDEVKRVMRRIFEEAHVPSLSFTGGEPTLRRELPDLIRYGKELGFRVNLISNGVRLADTLLARRLVAAGLDSAQISLEAADAALHDRLVGRPGAWEHTTAAIRNLQRLGVHVHTNTTLCAANHEHLPDLIRFLARDLRLRTMSMNMVIRTGAALDQPGQTPPVEVSYSEVAQLLPELRQVATAEGIRFVWYSPIPYCLFNPALEGLGAKSCACVDGILSVDPRGQVLPCSSFSEGLGSLLERPFERIYKSRAARFWRRKQFAPPVCRDCPDLDLCGGACPLYWDAAGSFAEIPRPGSDDPRARRQWERRRKRGRSYGVRGGGR